MTGERGIIDTGIVAKELNFWLINRPFERMFDCFVGKIVPHSSWIDDVCVQLCGLVPVHCRWRIRWIHALVPIIVADLWVV